MRASKVDFVRQLGFATEDWDDSLFSPLMFQPRAIGAVVTLGVVLQSPWVFLALSAVLWWSAVVPSRNPFDDFFNLAIAGRWRLRAVPVAPPPRRFAQAMAATVALTIGGALLAGASLTAWLAEGVFVAALIAVVVGRSCFGARVYHVLRSRGGRANRSASGPVSVR